MDVADLIGMQDGKCEQDIIMFLKENNLNKCYDHQSIQRTQESRQQFKKKTNNAIKKQSTTLNR